MECSPLRRKRKSKIISSVAQFSVGSLSYNDLCHLCIQDLELGYTGDCNVQQKILQACHIDATICLFSISLTLFYNPYYLTNGNPCLFLCLSLVHTMHQSLLLQFSFPLWWLLPSLFFQYDWPTFSCSISHLLTSNYEGLHHDTVHKLLCLVPCRCVCKCTSRSFRIIKNGFVQRQKVR